MTKKEFIERLRDGVILRVKTLIKAHVTEALEKAYEEYNSGYHDGVSDQYND